MFNRVEKSRAFSIAEAFIMLTIVSVALAAAAPMITKQIKHNNLSSVQTNLLGREIDRAEMTINTNSRNINNLSADVATLSQRVNNLYNSEVISNILSQTKSYDKDIAALRQQLNNINSNNGVLAQIESLNAQMSNKATTSSLNTLNSNLTSLISNEIKKVKDEFKNKLVPTGAVMAFNLTSCPSGWSKLTEVIQNTEGAFIRNIGGNAGSLRAVQNPAAPNIKGCFGYQNGGISYTGAFYLQDNNTLQGVTDKDYNNDYACLDASRSSSVYSDSAKEVRPKNVTLLYCVKN